VLDAGRNRATQDVDERPSLYSETGVHDKSAINSFCQVSFSVIANLFSKDNYSQESNMLESDKSYRLFRNYRCWLEVVTE